MARLLCKALLVVCRRRFRVSSAVAIHRFRANSTPCMDAVLSRGMITGRVKVRIRVSVRSSDRVRDWARVVVKMGMTLLFLWPGL